MTFLNMLGLVVCMSGISFHVFHKFCMSKPVNHHKIPNISDNTLMISSKPYEHHHQLNMDGSNVNPNKQNIRLNYFSAQKKPLLDSTDDALHSDSDDTQNNDQNASEVIFDVLKRRDARRWANRFDSDAPHKIFILDDFSFQWTVIYLRLVLELFWRECDEPSLTAHCIDCYREPIAITCISCNCELLVKIDNGTNTNDWAHWFCFVLAMIRALLKLYWYGVIRIIQGANNAGKKYWFIDLRRLENNEMSLIENSDARTVMCEGEIHPYLLLPLL